MSLSAVGSESSDRGGFGGVTVGCQVCCGGLKWSWDWYVGGLDLLGLLEGAAALGGRVFRKNARVANRDRCFLVDGVTLGGGHMRARTGLCLERGG